jgi:CBS domain-containing protein
VAELVSEIMERDPVTVSPDTSVQDVVAAMREHQLPGVPVVDADGTCVGIVTEADLVLPDEDGDLHIPHYINLFGGTVFLESLHHFEERLNKAFAANAEDMMTRNPDTVRPDTSVHEAARLVHEAGHNRLPVVEDGKLVGVVTRLDLLGALTS